MKNSNEVFELRKILDDPRFTGFECDTLRSGIGERNRQADFIVPYDANRIRSLAKHWDKPNFCCEGEISPFNDYPSAGLGRVPIFSQKAVDALMPLLKGNGELLPLGNHPFGRNFYCFHSRRLVKGTINLSRAEGVPFHAEPTTLRATRFFSLDRYPFYKTKIPEFPVFRIAEVTNRILVKREFVDAVFGCGLFGFEFRQVWPFSEKQVIMKTNNPQEWVKIKGRRRSAIAQTIVVKLPVNAVPVPRKVLADAAKVREHLSEILTTHSRDEIPLGASQGIESEGRFLRLDFSCPDADRLFEALLPQLSKIRWPGFRIYKRHAEFYNLNEPLIELKKARK